MVTCVVSCRSNGQATPITGFLGITDLLFVRNGDEGISLPRQWDCRPAVGWKNVYVYLYSVWWSGPEAFV